jgi:hypothetical protein
MVWKDSVYLILIYFNLKELYLNRFWFILLLFNHFISISMSRVSIPTFNLITWVVGFSIFKLLDLQINKFLNTLYSRG